VPFKVHGQGRAQVGEAGVHLAADRTAVGALTAVGGKEVGFGFDLVQILGDCQRIPDLQPVVGEAGHEE
jgi:hypothetical protein